MWLEFRSEMSGLGSAPSYAECPVPRSLGGASCYRLVSKSEIQTETRPGTAAISELLHALRASYVHSPEYFPCHPPPVHGLVASMPAAANPPDPIAQPAPWPASTDRRGNLTRLIGLVRKLIDYGKELAASLHQRSETTDLRPVMCAFGTRDIARILARITCGLLRAQALADKVHHNAARLDAPPRPNPQPAASPRSPSAPRPRRDRQLGPDLAPLSLPTPEQIAAKVRCQSIGAVITDICRDLGICPNHPLWRELQSLIEEYRGDYASLVLEILDRPSITLFEREPTVQPTNPPTPACATGPP
jgi:hypothetical protein